MTEWLHFHFSLSLTLTHLNFRSVFLFSLSWDVEGMMLTLKLQYFGHLMRRVDSLEKTVMLGGIGRRRRRGRHGWDGWMASLTRWTWVWVNSGSWWWTGRPGVLWFMGSQRVGHDWVTELNSFPNNFNNGPVKHDWQIYNEYKVKPGLFNTIY